MRDLGVAQFVRPFMGRCASGAWERLQLSLLRIDAELQLP